MKDDKFIWFNKDVFVMSLFCFVIMWFTHDKLEQAVIGSTMIYFGCLALWNLKGRKNQNE